MQKQLQEYIKNNLFLVAYSLFGTILCTILIQNRNEPDLMKQLFYGFSLGLIACLGGEYFSHLAVKRQKTIYIGTALFFVFGFLISRYLGYLPSFEIHILAAAYLLFLLTPPAVRKDEKLGFHWIIHTLYALGLSITISLILMALVSFLAWVIKELFGIEIPDLVRDFGLSFFMIFLVVNLFALFKPLPEDVPRLRYEISRLIEKTLGVLFTPVMLVYIAVLLAYSIKVLVQFSLPRGMASIPISIAYGMFFLLEAYYESQGKENQGLWKYRHWIRLSFIPLLIMMAIAIFTRIHDYGFTQDRYYLLMGYIIILATFLIRLRYKALEARKLIALTALMILISSCGPLSPSYVSVRSQSQRFLNILKKYGSNYKNLEDFQVSTWAQKDIDEAYSALTVVTNYKSMDKVEKRGVQENLFQETESKNLAFNIEDVRNKLGNLSQPHFYRDRKSTDAKFDRPCQTFNVPWSSRPRITTVSGYDQYFKLDNSINKGLYLEKLPDNETILKVSLLEEKLWVEHNGKTDELIHFGPKVREHIEKKGANTDAESLEFEGQNKNFKVKFIVHRMLLGCDTLELESSVLVKKLK